MILGLVPQISNLRQLVLLMHYLLWLKLTRKMPGNGLNARMIKERGRW